MFFVSGGGGLQKPPLQLKIIDPQHFCPWYHDHVANTSCKMDEDETCYCEEQYNDDSEEKDEDREIVTLSTLKEWTEKQKKKNDNSYQADLEPSLSPGKLMSRTGIICGSATTAILGAVYFWNETIGLDLVTIILSLIALIYVWTNG